MKKIMLEEETELTEREQKIYDHAYSEGLSSGIAFLGLALVVLFILLSIIL